MKKIYPLIALVIIVIFGAIQLNKTLPPSVSKTPALISLAPSVIATPAASSNIEVVMPKEGDSISSPVLITGNARVSQNVVYLRLTTSEGYVLASDTTSVNNPSADGYGIFEDNFYFNVPQTKEGFLEAYQVSSVDGSEIDTVKIPVKFK